MMMQFLAHQAQVQTRILQEMHHENILRSPKYDDPKRLARFERQVFAQHGEDGVIEEIFRRIGLTNKIFVEIGVGNGLQNNTSHLLRHEWSGTWVEGDDANVKAAREQFAQPLGSGKLNLIHIFVTPQNISQALTQARVPAEFDLLSVDIDRNTHTVWGALDTFRPRAVVVEYNATIPPGDSWQVHDAPTGLWDGTHYFGASLKTFDEIGRRKGYSLVGCDTSGTNAFFVRNDLLGDHFAAPFTPEHHYEPPRYYLSRVLGHPPGFTDGARG
jgi:hypothetical protein